jgi:ferredoxin
VHAIHLAGDDSSYLPMVDLQICNGCGACFAQCPAEAISLHDGSLA